MRRLLPSLALMLLAALAGCGDEPRPATGGGPTPPVESALVACPVEGTRFRPGSGVIVTIEGRAIEVCSRGCRERLEGSPEDYLKEGGR